MFRRRFLQVMTLATAGGLAPLEAMATGANTIVTFHVRGFSCITCARPRLSSERRSEISIQGFRFKGCRLRFRSLHSHRKRLGMRRGPGRPAGKTPLQQRHQPRVPIAYDEQR